MVDNPLQGERRIALYAGTSFPNSSYRAKQDMHLHALDWQGAPAGIYVSVSCRDQLLANRVFPPHVEDNDVQNAIACALDSLAEEYHTLSRKPKREGSDVPRFRELSKFIEAA